MLRCWFFAFKLPIRPSLRKWWLFKTVPIQQCDTSLSGPWEYQPKAKSGDFPKVPVPAMSCTGATNRGSHFSSIPIPAMPYHGTNALGPRKNKHIAVKYVLALHCIGRKVFYHHTTGTKDNQPGMVSLTDKASWIHQSIKVLIREKLNF